ncbi:ornithine cyclodeaminase family protein [Streptomyces sp. NPDC059340]|uniref:ornithine cyclodeaminase family protein n=1 Tax=Streptomyces sp. NPDC059340 TaxID=3346806 RepID=UPI003683146F
MRFISEAESAALISEELAFTAVREALIAAAEGADSFPTVLGHGSDSENRFTVKSAASRKLAGVKIGSYWPGNADRGIPRHNSIVLLFDQTIGRIAATIEAGTVNAYRTAAADAADALARADAGSLRDGTQALYECAVVSKVRPFDTIHVVARSAERGERFLAEHSRKGLYGRLTTAREACLDADVIVTATTARSPLDADWIRPGTHIASMGSDAHGKQELPPTLLKKARLFCDLPTQSVANGEFQNIADLVADGTLRLDALGDVLTGKAEGRRTPEDITVFDSSGIALQDLWVATALLNAVPNAPSVTDGMQPANTTPDGAQA